MSKNIFVYGTLRKGYGNHRLLKGSKLVCNAKSVEKYTMTAAGIPFVSRKPLVEITGEVYEVPDDQLPSIDALEGHPHAYKREPMSYINLDTKEQGEAELYFYEHENRRVELIESGDYSKYRNKV
ncbi:UNVERIFIED_CONTAM: hypothetical protein GTU68_023855 [Idotea baltica]|nr:hypothetical protein [Idotea baltica]